jgi:hypothetical protein
VIDSSFETADLSRQRVEDEPEGATDDIEGVLADAEAIVEEAEPEVVAEVEAAEHESNAKRGWWRFGRRRPDDGDDFKLSER